MTTVSCNVTDCVNNRGGWCKLSTVSIDYDGIDVVCVDYEKEVEG